MSNKMNTSLFCEHLQHTPATQLCPHVGGHAIPFPTHFEEFPMDVAGGLKGYKLATTTKAGVNRFALRRPDGRILTPMNDARRVRARIDGVQKTFNVSNLLASYVLNKDVTDNEYGILLTADGMWIESAADRTTLCTELKLKRNALPRAELDYIQRPDSSDIDVRGKGYYVERGVVYKKDGTPIRVSKTGDIKLTGAMGKQEKVGLGWVLFAAYPDFYGYKHGIHTQMDHINGISTDNEAWNFRPMTVHQNAAVRHQTGSRSRRPSPNSSHERFKSKYPEEKLTPRMISNWQKNGSLRRYAETSYWLHKDGAVLLRQSSGFVYAEPRVNRHDYTIVGNNGDRVHNMMMRAFGKYKTGSVVMHMDNYKENNALSNLKMGTNEENADGKKAVQITIQRADGTEVATIYRSESEAARCVEIHRRTINDNRKRQRPDSPRKFTTTKRGIKFAATDPPQPQTSPM
jgi:hypothetical protein